MVGCGGRRGHMLAVVLLLRLRRFVLLLLFEIATASMVSRIYAFTSWSLVVGCGGLVQRRGLRVLGGVEDRALGRSLIVKHFHYY